MRRDLSRLVDTPFDLLVIGAGIHGACVAWDACLRGVSVVEPLPVLVPTYGHLSRGRVAHRIALLLNDLISRTRNRGLDADRVIPAGRLVSPRPS